MTNDVQKMWRDYETRFGKTATDPANNSVRKAESAIDVAAAQVRKVHPELTKEQAIAKALENDPSLYTGYHREELQKSGYIDDSLSEKTSRLEKAGQRLQKADPSLTKEQAVAKALSDDPSLYEDWR